MVTELQAAIAAAREAGALLRDAFGQSHTVTLKQSAIDLVTEMDQAANTLIIERLQTAYPGYGFYTEESPAIRGTADAHWLIDPLDGTTNYVHGYPFFAVSIALEQAGQLAVGVVYNPISDELFAAQRGHGATLNGRPIHVSEASTLRDSLLASGFPYNAWESENDNATEWQQFLKRVRSLRCDGSSALDLCFVACGRTDGYWEHELDPWDVAAGALIVMEAGGRVTDYQGEDKFISNKQIVAANPSVHTEMLAVLRSLATRPP